ncbi:Hypothetical protein NTJ_14323 [Nesidiocoris tenuis]|uniref:MD-2-related lipid-recognition domain-containing protein n=1 Tax=Nesidiocoris tenuis TaxID=355587 RepID=A0ABN7BEE4_9HEMI|nr:Hypothetical protein NTJ_14323 [Nesidiocoris tenuis]
MDAKYVIFSILVCLWCASVETARYPRASGELVINIKGFDNCTKEGKGLIRWIGSKMKFSRHSDPSFTGLMHLGFPLTNNGTTPVKLTTYFLQNGGYKMLFKSERKSIFELLNNLSPKMMEGLMTCFNTTTQYLPPGEHTCTNWIMHPIKRQLPIVIKSKGYCTIDFYKNSSLMGCFKMLFDIN